MSDLGYSSDSFFGVVADIKIQLDLQARGDSHGNHLVVKWLQLLLKVLSGRAKICSYQPEELGQVGNWFKNAQGELLRDEHRTLERCDDGSPVGRLPNIWLILEDDQVIGFLDPETLVFPDFNGIVVYSQSRIDVSNITENPFGDDCIPNDFNDSISKNEFFQRLGLILVLWSSIFPTSDNGPLWRRLLSRSIQLLTLSDINQLTSSHLEKTLAKALGYRQEQLHHRLHYWDGIQPRDANTVVLDAISMRLTFPIPVVESTAALYLPICLPTHQTALLCPQCAFPLHALSHEISLSPILGEAKIHCPACGEMALNLVADGVPGAVCYENKIWLFLEDDMRKIKDAVHEKDGANHLLRFGRFRLLLPNRNVKEVSKTELFFDQIPFFADKDNPGPLIDGDRRIPDFPVRSEFFPLVDTDSSCREIRVGENSICYQIWMKGCGSAPFEVKYGVGETNVHGQAGFRQAVRFESPDTVEFLIWPRIPEFPSFVLLRGGVLAGEGIAAKEYAESPALFAASKDRFPRSLSFLSRNLELDKPWPSLFEFKSRRSDNNSDERPCAAFDGEAGWVGFEMVVNPTRHTSEPSPQTHNRGGIWKVPPSSAGEDSYEKALLALDFGTSSSRMRGALKNPNAISVHVADLSDYGPTLKPYELFHQQEAKSISSRTFIPFVDNPGENLPSLLYFLNPNNVYERTDRGIRLADFNLVKQIPFFDVTCGSLSVTEQDADSFSRHIIRNFKWNDRCFAGHQTDIVRADNPEAFSVLVAYYIFMLSFTTLCSIRASKRDVKKAEIRWTYPMPMDGTNSLTSLKQGFSWAESLLKMFLSPMFDDIRVVEQSESESVYGALGVEAMEETDKLPNSWLVADYGGGTLDLYACFGGVDYIIADSLNVGGTDALLFLAASETKKYVDWQRRIEQSHKGGAPILTELSEQQKTLFNSYYQSCAVEAVAFTIASMLSKKNDASKGKAVEITLYALGQGWYLFHNTIMQGGMTNLAQDLRDEINRAYETFKHRNPEKLPSIDLKVEINSGYRKGLICAGMLAPRTTTQAESSTRYRLAPGLPFVANDTRYGELDVLSHRDGVSGSRILGKPMLNESDIARIPPKSCWLLQLIQENEKLRNTSMDIPVHQIPTLKDIFQKLLTKSARVHNEEYWFTGSAWIRIAESLGRWPQYATTLCKQMEEREHPPSKQTTT